MTVAFGIEWCQVFVFRREIQLEQALEVSLKSFTKEKGRYWGKREGRDYGHDLQASINIFQV